MFVGARDKLFTYIPCSSLVISAFSWFMNLEMKMPGVKERRSEISLKRTLASLTMPCDTQTRANFSESLRLEIVFEFLQPFECLCLPRFEVDCQAWRNSISPHKRNRSTDYRLLQKDFELLPFLIRL